MHDSCGNFIITKEMIRLEKWKNDETINMLCAELRENAKIDPNLYDKFGVKRGLRYSDGRGVVAGITKICNVHGYVVNEGEVEPIPGELIYRGCNIKDIIENNEKEDRFGFEETAYLLLFGKLPTTDQLESFTNFMASCRTLPSEFVVDMILKAPSPNIMNKLSRSVLALYSYDDNSENKDLESELRMAIELIARLPVIMVNAYQAKRRVYDNKSFVMHPINFNENTAQSILSTMRVDRKYTKAEAQLLDTLLVLQAEHGGGNNSTFACRVLTSSGTDAYSAYSAAIGSLKGPRHGGANLKVMEMLEDVEAHVKNWEDEGEVADYLRKILNKEANDKSGLIYGMGHAVYTLSDPRAEIIKKKAMELARGKDIEAEFKLLDLIERLAPELFAEKKGDTKVICANVDMYSGLVNKMLRIPPELYTPLFAVARMAGWAAHRIEEIITCNRIIRPAYKAVAKPCVYRKIDER